MFPRTIGIAILAVGAQAAPRSANLLGNFIPPVIKAPQGPPVVGDVVSEVVEYDAAMAIQAVPAAVLNTVKVVMGPAKHSKINARSLGDCAIQPASPYTGPEPYDSATSFLSFPYFAEQAQTAPCPPGYAPSFINSNAANNALEYLGYTRLATYDTYNCAAQCDAIAGCSAINIYFERDPTLDAGPGCPCPSSQTNVKCVFWGGEVTLDNALNNGQYRDDFEVVIAGSNGYNLHAGPQVLGYIGPINYGNNIIDAPQDHLGQYTLLGAEFFTDTPFDPELCAAACDATTAAHALLSPPGFACDFFNTYILYLNNVAQGQGCSLYSETWGPEYATNSGYPGAPGQTYTFGESLGYSNALHPNYASAISTFPPTPSSSSTSTSSTSSASTTATSSSPTLP